LSPARLKKLSSGLSNTHGSVEIVSLGSGDKEVGSLTAQLQKGFQGGGWTITKVTEIGSFGFAGLPAMPDNVLICGAPNKDAKPVAAAIRALEDAGLKCEFSKGYSGPFMPGPISAGIPATPDVVLIIRKREPKSK
jgi:hypothetical protein